MFKLTALLVALVLPIATAKHQGEEGLLNLVPNVEALKTLCTAVQQSQADTTGRVAEWVAAAKPACQRVANMSNSEMETFLEQEKAAYLKSSEEMLKQRCKALKGAQDKPEMEWFKKQAWYPQLNELCGKIAEHPEQIPTLLAHMEENANLTVLAVESLSGGNKSFGAVVNEENLVKGCKMLEDGAKNGEHAWFENAPWYTKAKALCTEVKKDRTPTNVVMGICRNLKNTLMTATLGEGNDDWIKKARETCNAIDGQPEWFVALYLANDAAVMRKMGVDRVHKYCQKFDALKATPLVAGFSSQEWYKNATQLCDAVQEEVKPKGTTATTTAKPGGKGAAEEGSVEGSIEKTCEALEAVPVSADDDKDSINAKLKATCDLFKVRNSFSKIDLDKKDGVPQDVTQALTQLSGAFFGTKVSRALRGADIDVILP